MATPPPPGRTPAEQTQPGLLDALLLRVFLTIPKAFTLPFAVLTRHHIGGAFYGVGTLFCQVPILWLAGWGLSESGLLPATAKTDVRQLAVPAGLWLLSWLNLAIIKVRWERDRRRGRNVLSSYPGELRALPTHAGTRIFGQPALLGAAGAAATVIFAQVAPWFIFGPFVILAGAGAMWEGLAFWLYCHRLEVKTSDARAMAEGIGETGQRVAAWKAQEAVASRIQQARRAEGRGPAPGDASAARHRHEDAAPDAAALMRRFSGGAEEKEDSI